MAVHLEVRALAAATAKPTAVELFAGLGSLATSPELNTSTLRKLGSLARHGRCPDMLESFVVFLPGRGSAWRILIEIS